MTEYERLQRAVIVAACNWRNHPKHSHAVKELETAIDDLNAFIKSVNEVDSNSSIN